MLQDNQLFSKLLECSKDSEYLEEIEEKKQTYEELIEKVVNARFSDDFRVCRAEFTVRGCNSKENNFTLRQNLDSYGRKRKSNDKKRKKEIKIPPRKKIIIAYKISSG